MPRLICAISSLFSALRLCLFDGRYRKLAAKPWLIGALTYSAAIVASYYLHGPILHRMVSEPTGFFSWIVFIGAWIAVTIGLVASTMIISVAIVLVFSAVYQTDLVRAALSDLGVPVPTDEAGLHGTFKETVRTVYVETTKLLWLIPLGVTAFFTGLFPILIPFTVLLISWLLAYQFTDLTLDVLRVPPLKRLRLALSHSRSMIWFGLALSALWAIPFLGFLLPPVAAVAAAQYLERIGFLKLVQQEPGPISARASEAPPD